MAKKEITKKRNNQIKNRFKLLYEQERKRLDDVYEILSEEFYLSEARIHQIISGKF